MVFFDFCRDMIEVVVGYGLKWYRTRLDHRLKQRLAVLLAATMAGVVGYAVGASDLPWWILPLAASTIAATAGIVYVCNPARCVARAEARRDRVLLDWVDGEIKWLREHVSDVVWAGAREPLETVRMYVGRLVERRRIIEACQHTFEARPFRLNTDLVERSGEISKQLATIVPGIVRHAQDRKDAIKTEGEQVEAALEAFCMLLERAEFFILELDNVACDLKGFNDSLEGIARAAAPLLDSDQPDAEGHAKVVRLHFPGKHS